MSSNLLVSNIDYDGHVEFVRSVSPDIIVFQEYTRSWHVALSTALEQYPFRLAVPIDSAFGIAVYSKLQLSSEEIVFLENQSRPSVEITVSLDGRELKILGTHPPPPVSSGLYAERNRHLQKISERLKGQETPVVILGDLNVSPWSNHFSEFLSEGGLFDGRRGFGILPTWPTGFWPLQIPIDHIVGTGTVSFTSIKTSNGLGSDHRAIWADIEF